MDTDTGLAPGSAPAPAAPASEGPLSIREAVNSFVTRREKGLTEHVEPPAPAEPSNERARTPDGKFAPQNTAPAVEDAPAQPTSVDDEDQVVLEPADDEQPTVEPPRSWTKEEKEAFRALPPEHQQRIADRERAREVEIRRGQNEAAETRKAAEAARQQAEQAKAEYERQLQSNLQTLTALQNHEFSDIKTPEDVMRLASEDPFRYAQFDARQKQIEHFARETETAERRRVEEQHTQFTHWASEQDKLFVQQAKEFADPEKAVKARDEVISYLTDVRGLNKDELPALWNNPLFRDAKMQLIVRDAAKFHAAQQRAKAAVQKPVPPVQRPGTAPAKGESQAAEIKALEQRLEKSTNVRDQITAAAALRAAKRVAAR